MKKKHFILSCLFLCSILSFGQSISKQQLNIPQVEFAPTNNPLKSGQDFLKPSNFNSKAFGDTLYYEDFDSSNWSVVNNNPNNFQWTWATVYRPGQFTLNTPTITSTTAGNGFMLLAAGFFNTPIPGTGPVAMNTYFESDLIDLTSNGINPNGHCGIWVTYQQSLRYCCSGANRLVLQASTDNFVTFEEYDATNAIAVNAASGTVTNTINISNAAAYSPNVKIRFLSEGNSHYYWMIDDITIIEPPLNDAALLAPYLEFNSGYQYNPFYSQIPYDLFTPLPLSGTNVSLGCNTLTNARLEASFVHVTDPSGNPGLGNIFNTSSTPTTLGPPDNAVTSAPYFVPLVLGEFRVDMLTNSDSIDQNIGNESYTHTFSTSDTIFAKDNNNYSGGTGPGSFVRNGLTGGQIAGDKFGTMYIIESRSGNGGFTKVPTSITFAVSNNPSNLGVEISPKIWKYEEDSLFAPASGTIDAAFGAEVASSFIPYTIQTYDTLITLPLDFGSAVLNGLDNGQYVVGWEVTNTNGGNNFEVAEEVSTGQFQKDITCFINLAHDPGWGWVDVNPVIRLNMGNLPISSGLSKNSDSNSTVKTLPNPSNGLFTLKFKNQGAKSYQLTVRNSLGQLIFSELTEIDGNSSKKIDLRNQPKGVYFMSATNETERIVETLIIQ